MSPLPRSSSTRWRTSARYVLSLKSRAYARLNHQRYRPFFVAQLCADISVLITSVNHRAAPASVVFLTLHAHANSWCDATTLFRVHLLLVIKSGPSRANLVLNMPTHLLNKHCVTECITFITKMQVHNFVIDVDAILYCFSPVYSSFC